jgi:hypothetical protein
MCYWRGSMVSTCFVPSESICQLNEHLCFWGRGFFNARSEKGSFFCFGSASLFLGLKRFFLLAPDPRSYFYLFCAERMQIHLLKSASGEKETHRPTKTSLRRTHKKRALMRSPRNGIKGSDRLTEK